MEIIRLQKNVAIMIDGNFFLKRFNVIFGKDKSPREIADKLEEMVRYHLSGDNLYRIFYYDCCPYTKREQSPISGDWIDFANTKVASDRLSLFEELKSRRKMALRLSEVQSRGEWLIRPQKVKTMLEDHAKANDLTADDLYFNIQQKGVEMKIGVDIATLTLKKLINKVILIAGDSDFVPAAKMARYEGVDFVLDPMWNPIKDELYEHIDGLKSVCPRPERYQNGERDDKPPREVREPRTPREPREAKGDAQPRDPRAHEMTSSGQYYR